MEGLHRRIDAVRRKWYFELVDMRTPATAHLLYHGSGYLEDLLHRKTYLESKLQAMASLEAMGVSFQGTTMLRNEHKLVNTQLAQLVLTLEELEEDYSKDREPSCYLALEAMTTLIKNMRENNLSDAEDGDSPMPVDMNASPQRGLPVPQLNMLELAKVCLEERSEEMPQIRDDSVAPHAGSVPLRSSCASLNASVSVSSKMSAGLDGSNPLVHQNSVDIHVYAGKVASSRHHGIKRSAADNDFTGSAGAQPIITQPFITQPIVRPQPRPFLRVKRPAKAVSEAGQRNGMESTLSGDDELTEVLRSQRNVSKTGNNGSVESMPSGSKESVQIVSIASEELHNVLPQQPATCPTQEPQKKTVLGMIKRGLKKMLCCSSGCCSTKI